MIITYFLLVATLEKVYLLIKKLEESFLWVSEVNASKALGVDIKTLEFFREEGLLNPGVHWKSSSDSKQLPWKPKVIYCISLCKEVFKRCNKGDFTITPNAA